MALLASHMSCEHYVRVSTPFDCAQTLQDILNGHQRKPALQTRHILRVHILSVTVSIFLCTYEARTETLVAYSFVKPFSHVVVL